MTDWKLGQYVRVWRGGSVGEHDAGGYEYGHIEMFDFTQHEGEVEVMLAGDYGKEIYCQVEDLEEGE